MIKQIQNLLLSAVSAVLMVGCASAGTGSPAESANPSDSSGDVQIGAVETDTITMEYVRFGSGPKTMVIIPGLSVQSVIGSSELIAKAYEVFAEEYTVYLFDRRKNIPDPYPIETMAEDTITAMKELNLSHVNLFGASQGGMIAMVIAMKEPALVDKLVLGSTSARVNEENKKPVEEWIRYAREKDAEGLYLSFGEMVYSKEVFEQSRDLLIEAAKTVTDEELDRFIILAGGIADFDVLDRLNDIACPVLVIGSKDDRIFGETGTLEIADALKDHPDCSYFLYDGYGHAVYDTAPDYKQRLLEFFSSNG